MSTPLSNLPDHAAMVAAILAAHGERFGPPLPVGNTAAHPADPPVYAAALQACGALGFIDPDARCLAQAWQSASLRSGRFDATRWPDDAADFGLQAPDAADTFAPCPRQLGLYAVLPDAAWVARMARAGVPTLQLRFKSEDPAAIEHEVQAAVAAVRGSASLLFINDHWQAAVRAGAYGVHLGQEDLDGANLASIRQAGLRLGLSTHGYAEMLRASALGPSYLALGAVFPTTLKRMSTAPQGLARLAAYARLAARTPLVAIGGIDAQSLPAVLATGVGSVAVVRAIVAADRPEAAAAHLQTLVCEHMQAPQNL